MSMSLKETGEGRGNIAPSFIIQPATASFSASDYPTGGYPVTGAPVGLGYVRGMIPAGYIGTASNYLWEYVPSAVTPGTGNLLVQSAPGTQVAANTDLSGAMVAFQIVGF